MVDRIEYMINGVKYRLISDLHTHTTFSHGKGSIEDNVLAARSKGVMKLGIADHGPGHIGFGINRKDIPLMRAEVERLKTEYPDMEILLGIEANIVNSSGILDVKPEEFKDFDYVIAGYHYGVIGENPITTSAAIVKNFAEEKMGRYTKRLRRVNTQKVVKSLYENDIKILTHPGDKAPVDLLEIAVACAETNTLVELNTHHYSLTEDDLRTMSLADIKYVISSDAHKPNRVGDFFGAVELALSSGIDMSKIVNLEIE